MHTKEMGQKWHGDFLTKYTSYSTRRVTVTQRSAAKLSGA